MPTENREAVGEKKFNKLTAINRFAFNVTVHDFPAMLHAEAFAYRCLSSGWSVKCDGFDVEVDCGGDFQELERFAAKYGGVLKPYQREELEALLRAPLGDPDGFQSLTQAKDDLLHRPRPKNHFEREELQDIRSRAHRMSKDVLNHHWKRAYYDLESAADHLDAMEARCTLQVCTLEHVLKPGDKERAGDPAVEPGKETHLIGGHYHALHCTGVHGGESECPSAPKSPEAAS